MHIKRSAVLVVLAAALAASGHLCNNIYRTPDRVIVKPEKQTVTLDKSDEFRVFVQNNYHTLLHNLRLSAKVDGAPGVTVAVTPDRFDKLKAGERVSYTVKLTAAPDAPKGERALQFGVTAQEIGYRPVQQPTVDQLVQSSNDGNHSPAVMAAESLARMDDPRGWDKLQNFAKNDDPDYRSRAIRAIGKVGNKKAVPFLQSLLAERNGWIKGNALLALGLVKDDAATFQPYVQDRDEFVKAAAVAGLALATGKDQPAWVAPFLKIGLKADDVYVRIACGWALAAQRDKDGIDVLDKAFETDDPRQRTTAGDAMVDVANRAL